MDATYEPGPDPDAITRYITKTWPETIIARVMNATFFSLDESHWPNFATIVTTDEHDDASNLSRPGVFRLNIGTLAKRDVHAAGGRTRRPGLYGDRPPHAASGSTPSRDGFRSSTRARGPSRRCASRSWRRPTTDWPRRRSAPPDN